MLSAQDAAGPSIAPNHITKRTGAALLAHDTGTRIGQSDTNPVLTYTHHGEMNCVHKFSVF